MVILDDRFINERTGNYWIGSQVFDSKIAFTDTKAKLYYMVMVADKVVNYGLLNGFVENSGFRYRFDFAPYIKVDNQMFARTRVLNNVVLLDSVNSIHTNLYIGETNLVTINLNNGSLIRGTDGSIIGDPSEFYDLIEPKFTSHNASATYNACKTNARYAVTAYAFTTITVGATTYSLIPDVGYDCVTGLIDIPLGTSNVIINGIQIPIDGISCNSPYYFINSNGMVETAYFSGVRNTIESVTKKNTVIDGKTFTISAKKKSQVKQNTGLNISNEQMYGVATAISIFQWDNRLQRYYIAESTFDGYNGKKLGSRNIELVLESDEEKNLYTSFSPKFII